MPWSLLQVPEVKGFAVGLALGFAISTLAAVIYVLTRGF